MFYELSIGFIGVSLYGCCELCRRGRMRGLRLGRGRGLWGVKIRRMGLLGLRSMG